MRELPELATPWTDKLGNVWCVLARGRDPVLYKLTTITTHQHPSPSTESEEWLEATWFAPAANAAMLHPDLLAGLGRTLPPVPSRKRVATVVQRGDGVEVAAKGYDLYFRIAEDPERWQRYKALAAEPRFVAAAHEAFQHAGSYLPGEEPE